MEGVYIIFKGLGSHILEDKVKFDIVEIEYSCIKVVGMSFERVWKLNKNCERGRVLQMMERESDL